MNFDIKKSLASFTQLLKDVATNAEYVSEAVYEERLNTCNSCDKIEHLPVLDTAICGVCKCVLESKAKWKNQKCPIDKWLAINDEANVKNDN
jgi:uncharacterized paraquat-inducible protein A